MKVARRAPGAGVRKPPMEETAGGVARWRVRRCGDLAAVNASTTFAIWHELCEWVKTPFAAPANLLARERAEAHIEALSEHNVLTDLARIWLLSFGFRIVTFELRCRSRLCCRLPSGDTE